MAAMSLFINDSGISCTVGHDLDVFRCSDPVLLKASFKTSKADLTFLISSSLLEDSGHISVTKYFK